MKARNKSLRGVGRVPAVVLCSLLLGAFCGFVFAKTGLFELTEGLSKTGVILADLWMLAAFALTFFLNIALHEAGHLIFGLLSGYGFVSYRLGSLMWMRENGRIVLKRFSLAGTGGQCLMSPPGGPDGDFPLMMYNFGGAAVNLVTAALLGALTAIGAAGLAAVCGVSGFLMAEAMNRREPKLSREVAQTLRKNAIPPQYGAGVYEAQERLRNAPHETVMVPLLLSV